MTSELSWRQIIARIFRVNHTWYSYMSEYQQFTTWEHIGVYLFNWYKLITILLRKVKTIHSLRWFDPSLFLVLFWPAFSLWALTFWITCFQHPEGYPYCKGSTGTVHSCALAAKNGLHEIKEPFTSGRSQTLVGAGWMGVDEKKKRRGKKKKKKKKQKKKLIAKIFRALSDLKKFKPPF